MWPAYKQILLLAYALVLKLLSKISLLPILGTARLYGVGTVCAPLIGFFCGVSSCAFVYCARTALSFSLGTYGGSFLVHLPTFAGSLVLSSGSRYASPLIAALCIGTFIAHPMGAESFIYTIYWLIPIGISFLPAPSIFLRSLMSTFITHAVGSTIFIYTHETTALFWETLFPQVWLERLTSALILTACYYAVTRMIHLINRLGFESNPCQNR